MPKQYFAYYEQVKDAKRKSTLYTENIIINHWIKHLATSGWIASRARLSTATSLGGRVKDERVGR